MGQVKRLWQDKVEKVHEDYVAKIIDYEEAYRRLCQLGYEPDYASDSLEACSILR